MCGRYNIISDGQALFDFFEVTRTLDLKPRYNVAPSQDVPVVVHNKGQRELKQYRWGLIPFWAKDLKIGYKMINARAETIAKKPAFRQAYQKRRCLIPATGFYEWKQTDDGKQPYHIRMANGAPFAFAGLWEHWKYEDNEIYSCSIITTEANAFMAAIHNRMPVILSPDGYDHWLESGGTTQLKPCADELLDAYPITTEVNNPRNDNSSIIETVGGK